MKRIIVLYTIFLVMVGNAIVLADGNRPRALRARSYDSSVYLRWTPPVNAASGYVVYRSIPGGYFKQLTLEPVEEPYYEDDDIMIGQYYIYKVSALDEGGYESDLSNAFGVEASDRLQSKSGY